MGRKKEEEKQLALANQQVVERLPEDKGALGFAAFAFAFSAGIGIVLAGCPGVTIRENDQTGSNHQRTAQQTYGQTALHGTFFV
jgi:hypothetical protein